MKNPKAGIRLAMAAALTLIPVQHLQGSAPPASAIPRDPADASAAWGPLARLVGTSWVGESTSQAATAGLEPPPAVRPIVRVSWAENGSAILFDMTSLQSYPASYIFRRTNAPGVLEAEWRSREWSGHTLFRVEGADRIVSDWYVSYKAANGVPSVLERHDLRLLSEGLLSGHAVGSETDRPDFTTAFFVPANAKDVEAVYAEQSALFAQWSDRLMANARAEGARIAAAVQAEMQERHKRLDAEIAERRARAGRMFGTLLLAGVGAAAAQTYGADANQTLGAAMKGAAMADPSSPLASALDEQGNALIEGSHAVPAFPQAVPANDEPDVAALGRPQSPQSPVARAATVTLPPSSRAGQTCRAVPITPSNLGTPFMQSRAEAEARARASRPFVPRECGTLSLQEVTCRNSASLWSCTANYRCSGTRQICTGGQLTGSSQ